MRKIAHGSSVEIHIGGTSDYESFKAADYHHTPSKKT
jgi:hypothetical protein